MRSKAIMLSAAACALGLYAEGSGTIEGRITNGVTGEAVSGVRVRFLEHGYVHESVTDATGRYRLTGLDDSDYFGEFTKDGFSGARVSQGIHVAGGVAAQADALIQPWGGLRGRVLDEEGKPAAGVRMECACASDGTTTDQNGDFAFHDVRPGSYTLAAKPEVKIRMEDGERMGTVAIYYPSVTKLEQAVPIPVGYGSDVAGIQIRLRSVPVHRVTGVVLNEAGKPAAQATVKLMGRPARARRMVLFSPGLFYVIGPAAEAEVAKVESGADGRFEFAAVEPGEWRLSAAEETDDERPLGGVASVMISDKDAEDVEVRLAAPLAVAFTEDRSSLPEPARSSFSGIPVRLVPMEGQPAVIVDPAKHAGRIDGILAGRYRVLPLAVNGGVYISSAMWEGRDVTGQVIELAAGDVRLDLTYKAGSGKVRGRAEGGGGCVAILVRDDPGEFTTVRMARCGADGFFALDGMAPGDYRVAAFDPMDERSTDWEAVPGLIGRVGSEVHVEAGATAPVEVSVSKGPE